MLAPPRFPVLGFLGALAFFARIWVLDGWLLDNWRVLDSCDFMGLRAAVAEPMPKRLVGQDIDIAGRSWALRIRNRGPAQCTLLSNQGWPGVARRMHRPSEQI